MRRSQLVCTAAIVGLLFVNTGAQEAPSDHEQTSSIPTLHPSHPPEVVRPPRVDPAIPLLDEPAIPINSATWTPFGPAPILNGQRPGGGPVSGRLTGIAAHPSDSNTIYVTAAGGGVWKTTDGGSAWTPVTETAVTQSMGAIAVAPSNPSVIYAGTGEANNSGDSNFGRGVLVSTDAGASWTLRNAGGAFDRRTVSEIAVDPSNSAVAYVAMSASGVNGASGNTGIWKTTDSGATWTNTTAIISTSQPYSSVRIDPNSPTTVYAAVGNLFGSIVNGVYKTTNGGTSWSLLANAPNGTSSGRIVIAVAKTNSNVVYVSAQSSSTFGLLKFVRSDDGGATFTDLTAGTPNYLGGQGWYDTTLIVDPVNAAVVYAGGAAGANSLIRSANSGVSWADIRQGSTSPFDGPHVDHHASAFDALGRFLDGNDGGIYRLDSTAPVHWTHLNGTLNTIQFQGIALHPTNPDIAFGGSQDNGTSRYTGTLGWTLVEGGDGGFVKFSKTNPTRIYHQAPVASFGTSGFFRRSDDGGTTWVSKVTGLTDSSSSSQNFYAPFVVDSGNGDRVLYGAAHVWETTNGGDNWTALGGAFSSNVTAIGLAPSDVNSIYAAASSQLWFTNNRGATWSQRNLPVSGAVRDLQVSATDPSTAYAVVGVFTNSPFGNVYKTTNSGVTWTNVSGNLSHLPTWSLQIDPTTPGRLFLGNDDGVYVTTNDGVAWTRLGTNLPSAQVFQVELNTTLGLIGAGTHGRGLWEISLPPPATVALTPDKSAPQAVNTTVTFTATATSLLEPVSYKFLLTNNNWATYSVVQDWSTTTTFAWTPTVADANYRVGVWARSAGVSTDAPEAANSVAFPITGLTVTNVALTADMSAPQPINTTITFTATPTGGVAPVSYKFLVTTNNWATYTVAQDWSTTNTFAWTPTVADGNYRMGVWARSAGNSANAPEAANSIPFAITAPSPLTVTLTADKTSPQATGTTITWTATPNSGTAPISYKFLVTTNNWATYAILRDWSTTATFAWIPVVADPNYRVGVWARSAGNMADTAEAASSQPFAITGVTLCVDVDADRLCDSYETSTGVYVSPINTGTNPNNPDTDGDRINDGDEVLGTLTGLNLPALGASALKKNILLEYDWFDDHEDPGTCVAHSHRPTAAMISRVAAAFAAAPNSNPDGSTGIALIQDYGQGGAFSGGSFVSHAGNITGGVNGADWQAVKLANFAANRRGYFHYVVMAHWYTDFLGSSGQAELPGNDLIVSLGCFASTTNVGNTIMHELGHNLNLQHGGDTSCNWKPNYNSVMNYRFQFPGIDVSCNAIGSNGESNTLDYSRGIRISLDENSLNEAAGSCGATPIDWNFNGIIQSGLAYDLNRTSTSPNALTGVDNTSCGGTLTTLSDYNDWTHLSFAGLSDVDGAISRTPEITDCNNPQLPRVVPVAWQLP